MMTNKPCSKCGEPLEHETHWTQLACVNPDCGGYCESLPVDQQLWHRGAKPLPGLE